MNRVFEKLKYAVALRAYRILEHRRHARKAIADQRAEAARTKE